MNEYIAAIVAQQNAFEARDIPSQNRWARRAEVLGRRILEKGAEGRSALEALLAHPTRSVQLYAATRVLAWSPGRAIPVLEELLLWGEEDRKRGLFSESLTVSSSAERSLARYYEVNIFDVLPLVRQKGGRA